MQTTAATAVKAERDRIAAIVALPEARGREEHARELALTTDLSVDQVKAKLAAETSALWDSVLASRGMQIGGSPPQGGTDAALWDAVLSKRFATAGA